MAEPNSPATNQFRSVLQDVAKESGFVEYKIEFDSGSTTTNGFVGSITKGQIVSTNKNLINFVIKSCDSSDKSKSVLPLESIFRRETYIYDTIFPAFQKFETEHGLEPLQLAPTYYKGCYYNQHHILILDDLNQSGYSHYTQNWHLDENHIKLGIKHYAHFHAVSLAYADQKHGQFQELTEMEDFHRKVFKDSGYIDALVGMMKRAVASLDPKLHQNAKEVYEKFISETESFILSLPDTVDKFSVIIHGDSWQNNMMFKYDDNSDPLKPTDIRLFDFQVSRLASPMLDVANFLFNCSSKEVMDNVDFYLAFYYDCLSERLQRLGSDPSKVYPVSVMKEHWRKFARYGLIVRLTTMVVLLSKREECKEMLNTSESDGSITDWVDYQVRDVEEYYDFARHTILHFVNNYLI